MPRDFLIPIVDISKCLKLENVSEAKKKSSELDISYKCHEALDFSQYKDEMHDVVVMNMVIHYIDDLDKLFAGIARVLKNKGTFVFSTIISLSCLPVFITNKPYLMVQPIPLRSVSALSCTQEAS